MLVLYVATNSNTDVYKPLFEKHWNANEKLDWNLFTCERWKDRSVFQWMNEQQFIAGSLFISRGERTAGVGGWEVCRFIATGWLYFSLFCVSVGPEEKQRAPEKSQVFKSNTGYLSFIGRWTKVCVKGWSSFCPGLSSVMCYWFKPMCCSLGWRGWMKALDLRYY